MTLHTLHETQNKILSLLEQGYDIAKMSLREVGKLIGEKNAQNVKYHINKLKEAGLFIERDDKNIINLPILGVASCGPALSFANENIEGYLKISKSILNEKDPKRLFVIKAMGDSMNNSNVNGKNIDDGDYVIVDLNYKKPINNDYILSTIDGFANIKKFYKDPKNKFIFLLSESTKDYPPICIHEKDYREYYVNGRVIEVIKSPKKSLYEIVSELD